MYMNNLLTLETFRGNFCVLRRSGATHPPPRPPPPAPCDKLMGENFPAGQFF